MNEGVARAQRRELRRAIGAETADMVIAQRAKLENYVEPGLKMIERTLPQHKDRLDLHEQLIQELTNKLKLQSQVTEQFYDRLGLLSACWQMSRWRRILWIIFGS